MKSTLACVALLMIPCAAWSAQSVSDAEPAVVTSPAAAPRGASPTAAPATGTPAAGTPAATAPVAPSTSRPATALPGATPSAAPGGTRQGPSTAPAARGNADRIELEATQITGNAELPRVMYVVPWKRAELGDLAGRPAKSLLDEVLTPVDRDVFRRQNRYYEALQPDAPKAAPEGEK